MGEDQDAPRRKEGGVYSDTAGISGVLSQKSQQGN